MLYNMNMDVITLSGTLVMFIGLVSAILSQQVGKGNYIVPRATLDLGHQTNRSAAGKKKKCKNNIDCEGFVNSQCCRTASGFYKCRKKCRKSLSFKIKHGHDKYVTNDITMEPQPRCNVGPKVYKQGEIVKAKDGCNKCMCNKGEMICTKLQCPPAKCRYKNKLYDDGYNLVLHNGCKRCVCQKRIWNCTSHPCKDHKMRNSVMSVVPSINLAVFASIYFFLFS